MASIKLYLLWTVEASGLRAQDPYRASDVEFPYRLNFHLAPDGMALCPLKFLNPSSVIPVKERAFGFRIKAQNHNELIKEIAKMHEIRGLTCRLHQLLHFSCAFHDKDKISS